MKLQELRNLIREEVRKTIKESYMSELDIIRQESNSVEEFIQTAVKRFPKLKTTSGYTKYLRDVYEIGMKMDSK
jgi:hypothetical protein